MKAVTKQLHKAIENENLELVQSLVETHGADIEDRDDSGETALHVACNNNNGLDIVKYLVRNCKANVEAESKWAWTPLLNACQRNSVEFVRYLVICGGARVYHRKQTALHLASSAWQCTIEMVLCLAMDCGIDVNATDEHGWTALHGACCYGTIDTVHCLIEACRANVDAKDMFGRTALHLACHYGKADKVQYLIETYQADVYAKDNYGWAALHHAVASSERVEKSRVVVLTKGRAHVDTSADNMGRTALHIAASQAFTHTCEAVSSRKVLVFLVEHLAADYM